MFKHLFMSNEHRTREFGARLGGLLGIFQGYLQDDMIIGVSRLMDPDKGKQNNLSMWALVERCEKWNPTVAAEVKRSLDALALQITDMRVHRHKRIAHFDLPVSLDQSKLPTVTFTEIREAIEKLESVLNFVSQRAADTTIMFDALDHRDITSAAELTIYKAMAYDAAVAAGKIELRDWRKHAIV